MCRPMGGSGCDLMLCSAPEFWTAAFEGPGNCTFKLWDGKQIKHSTVDHVLEYSSAMLGSTEILVFYMILYEQLLGLLHYK